jgi:hypothetical protein
MGKRGQPVAPIYQPEAPARAIFFAATHRRRKDLVGLSTVKATLANRIASGRIDRYLACAGYREQLTDQPLPDNVPGNLFEPVPGHCGAHGRFDKLAGAYFLRRREL